MSRPLRAVLPFFRGAKPDSNMPIPVLVSVRGALFSLDVAAYCKYAILVKLGILEVNICTSTLLSYLMMPQAVL